MKVIDPGHMYHLRNLDVDPDMGHGEIQPLYFVKREGDGYPGNVGTQAGTTTQEVLRALVERAHYVNNQIPDNANKQVIWHLRMAIWHLEERAARRHGRYWHYKPEQIEDLSTCPKCNHIGCIGDCHE